MYFEIYEQARTGLINALAQGQWRWRLKAANGEPIASGEGYVNKQDCERAIDLIKGTNQFTPVKDLSLSPINALAAAAGLRAR